MKLEPIARRSVADALHDQLLDAILSGDQAPGTTLPSERELAAAAGVNRQAVREALQRLRQADLVEIVHGGGVRVLDWRRSAGLALLPVLLVRGAAIDPAVARSIMELRVSIGADAARCCAERSAEATGPALAGILAEMEAAADGPGGWGDLGWRYWETVIEGAENIAYRLAFNTLRAVAEAVGARAGVLVGAERTELATFASLTRAIAEGRGDDAATHAREILSEGLRLTAALLGGEDALATVPG